jgi:hypothetical protein
MPKRVGYNHLSDHCSTLHQPVQLYPYENQIGGLDRS